MIVPTSVAYRIAFILAVSLGRPAISQTIQLTLASGQRFEGKVLFWDEQSITLLSRDGWLRQFAPSQAHSYRRSTSAFRSYSQAELRGRLMTEFGPTFEVSGTGHFLVTHPAGQRDQWAARFEQLYRAMVHYFTARGFVIQQPEFPLVAVVFPRQHDFLTYAASQNISGIRQETLGYYDPLSNRIYLYDITAGQPDERQWYLNAETIIHEAAHQTAFNIGIHRRFAVTPTWVVEGIGTLFEARGVWDSRTYPSLADRMHRAQCETFWRLVPEDRSVQVLSQQIAGDDLFPSQPTTAYSSAWALTFFLMENEPRKFAAYLTRLARRPVFQPYQPDQRVQDFTEIFGKDLRMLDARLRRFLQGLP